MPDWPIVSDISNYDYDADQDEPLWAAEFLESGISSIIIGSQWPYKAQAQLEAAKAAGLRVLGTYAEPDVGSAIALAHMAECDFVGLACERGSILTFSELSADVDAVRAAGLIPWLYGNAGDLIGIAGPLLETELIWLANYGMNDPDNPRDPITEYNFPGVGVRRLAAHQFSSTKVIAGRVRDRSYLYLEEDEMAQEDKDKIEKLMRIVAGWGFTDDDGNKLTNWEAIDYLDMKQRSEYEGLRLTQNAVALEDQEQDAAIAQLRGLIAAGKA